MLAGDTLVLVRGYADGEQGPWRQKLRSDTRSIEVHANIDPDPARSEYLMTFQSTQSRVELGHMETASSALCGNWTASNAQTCATYGNTDLPNLRADHIANLLSILIQGCPLPGTDVSTGPTKVEVLDGTVYPQHSPKDRKTRVYVVAYLKK